MVFRRIFRYIKWESVRAVIDGCGRLDVKHLIILRRIQFYRHIFYMNDSVLHNLFCALMSADCVYDNYMISVFTHDSASNVYKQFELICIELMWMFNCYAVCILSSVHHVCILLFVF